MDELYDDEKDEIDPDYMRMICSALKVPYEASGKQSRDVMPTESEIETFCNEVDKAAGNPIAKKIEDYVQKPIS